jgi:hypothetical protein
MCRLADPGGTGERLRPDPGRERRQRDRVALRVQQPVRGVCGMQVVVEYPDDRRALLAVWLVAARGEPQPLLDIDKGVVLKLNQDSQMIDAHLDPVTGWFKHQPSEPGVARLLGRLVAGRWYPLDATETVV